MAPPTRWKVKTAGVIALLASRTLSQTLAPPTSGNPPGLQYIAVLSNVGSAGSLSGSVVASSASNGSGIDIQISVSGLPAVGGPFCKCFDTISAKSEVADRCTVYYVSPSTNNCSGDPHVLDPYNAAGGTTCSQTAPQNCAVGDLWGKHGKMEPPNFNAK